MDTPHDVQELMQILRQLDVYERSLQFFRFRGPRCVGQRDLYSFATLFRELPVERREELIRRAMRWPDPLAEQVARVVRRYKNSRQLIECRGCNRHQKKVKGGAISRLTISLRFSCKNDDWSTI